MVNKIRVTDNKIMLTFLSTDTKPTNHIISTIGYETDTGKKFEYRGQPIGWVDI